MLSRLGAQRGLVVRHQLHHFRSAVSAPAVLHGIGRSLGARSAACQRDVMCWAATSSGPEFPGDSRDDKRIPEGAQWLVAAIETAVETAVGKAVAAAEEAKAEAKEAKEEARKTREMLGTVLEVAVREVYARLAVKGAGAILQSVDDVLQFVLPCHILLTAAQDQAFYRALRAAIIASLLDKDTGFLNAVIVLLKGEGMEQEAGQVEAVLRSGNGVEVVPRGRTGRKKTPKGRKKTPKGRKETPKGRKETPKGLRIVRQCLQAAESRAKAKGLGDDIRQLFQYCSGESRQARAELLETQLFVRCAAATLLGAYTGVLEVDAGAGVGGEVDEGAGALRLRAGETKYSPGEMDAADEQLQALFMLAAFTLDKVLAAAAAAPAASTARAALVQLPRRFIMDGFCVYAGKASEQQLQRRKAAADRRTVADASVIGKGKGSLESAVLQVHFLSARYARV
ncbi:hypothetical protein HYH02_001347 [Chlamydomonas schloesseri]|uniref:Uncharacterized protein n=1 Tax=Chlamydomonas schloesseri TaxID=2026947 RepID=A0A835WXV7_9CHLO|nr:hypothetical protein HYH02_001347 [Chlamydomonas schloesseri]|eukprot:KAG2454320.1 hypothetical protein HYH02_001347 [Chlamydomonas schloesseri]